MNLTVESFALPAYPTGEGPRSRGMMSQMTVCPLCRGSWWLCEDHLDQPWEHGGCGGAGVACVCNPKSTVLFEKVYAEAPVGDVDQATAQLVASVPEGHRPALLATLDEIDDKHAGKDAPALKLIAAAYVKAKTTH